MGSRLFIIRRRGGGGAPIARVHRASAAQVAAGATDDVSWEAADYDTGGFWSAGSPAVFTISADGTYRVTYSVQLSGVGTTGTRAVQLLRNGIVVSRHRGRYDDDLEGIGYENRLTAGDQLKVQVHNATDVVITIEPARSFFAIEKVG